MIKPCSCFNDFVERTVHTQDRKSDTEKSLNHVEERSTTSVNTFFSKERNENHKLRYVKHRRECSIGFKPALVCGEMNRKAKPLLSGK